MATSALGSCERNKNGLIKKKIVEKDWSLMCYKRSAILPAIRESPTASLKICGNQCSRGFMGS